MQNARAGGRARGREFSGHAYLGWVWSSVGSHLGEENYPRAARKQKLMCDGNVVRIENCALAASNSQGNFPQNENVLHLICSHGASCGIILMGRLLYVSEVTLSPHDVARRSWRACEIYVS